MQVELAAGLGEVVQSSRVGGKSPLQLAQSREAAEQIRR